MINQRETHDIMSYIFAEYDIVISDGRLKVWHDQIKHMDLDTAMQVARVLVGKKCFGAPKVSDFMEAFEEFSEVGKLSLEESWSKVFGTVLRFGRYAKSACLEEMHRSYPELYDITNTLFDEICNSAPSEIPVIRSQFWKMLGSNTQKAQIGRRVLPQLVVKAPNLTTSETKVLGLVPHMELGQKNAHRAIGEFNVENKTED